MIGHENPLRAVESDADPRLLGSGGCQLIERRPQSYGLHRHANQAVGQRANLVMDLTEAGNEPDGNALFGRGSRQPVGQGLSHQTQSGEFLTHAVVQFLANFCCSRAPSSTSRSLFSLFSRVWLV